MNDRGMNDQDAALLALLETLHRQDYNFVPPTPETHRRVISRPDRHEARDLRDVFGWSLPFAPALLPGGMLDLLDRGGMLQREGERMRSGVRVARIEDRLFLHSCFPTEQEDAVFLGPDSYRFVAFLQSELPRRARVISSQVESPDDSEITANKEKQTQSRFNQTGIESGVRRLVDIGAGAGVGALMAAPYLPGARLTLADVNPQALRLASINARHAGIEVELVEGDGIDAVSGLVDLAIANPPYIMDPDARTYRDGGDMHGARLSLDWTLAAARRLAPQGRVLLYTGVAIVDGRDALREALARELPALGCALRYREIDPDIFGEELDKPAYADVERIAAIGAVIEKS
ncbi:methyltransferase [Sphingomonas sp.]|uniref:methyltransferase n=1 Tax=Sphingomonas sp. TaxID=28214 RepID=UPI002FC6191F